MCHVKMTKLSIWHTRPFGLTIPCFQVLAMTVGLSHTCQTLGRVHPGSKSGNNKSDDETEVSDYFSDADGDTIQSNEASSSQGPRLPPARGSHDSQNSF